METACLRMSIEWRRSRRCNDGLHRSRYGSCNDGFMDGVERGGELEQQIMVFMVEALERRNVCIVGKD